MRNGYLPKHDLSMSVTGAQGFRFTIGFSADDQMFEWRVGDGPPALLYVEEFDEKINSTAFYLQAMLTIAEDARDLVNSRRERPDAKKDSTTGNA